MTTLPWSVRRAIPIGSAHMTLAGMSCHVVPFLVATA